MITSFKLINLGMSADSFAVLHNAAKRVLALRRLGLSEDDGYAVTVVLDGSLKNDRYIITAKSDGADIVAANDCAIHAAFGRLMLESKFDGKGGFAPLTECIDFTPAKPLRGMYFATHFHNFYHNAPIEQVYEVIEDLAMRGCNSLLVWFDMHHYYSMEDEGAQELVQRLRAMLKYANKIGMGGSLTMLSNEAFKSSPEELRAPNAIMGKYHTRPYGHYHVEICPSRPGGIEKILEYRRQMLEYFKDLKIDYVVYWPYDQGGCTCADCEPWGANGFLKLLPHFKALVKQVMPNTKVIVSTWYFNKFIEGEWQAFYDKLGDDMFKDVPYIMSFFHNGNVPECIRKGGIPEGVRFIDFPEISMWSCKPWGGYGASVLTKFLQTTNDASAHFYHGGFPYSEGIFEDANKFIMLSSYTGLYPNAYDALRAWVAHEFCCDDEELYQAILKTETALARGYDRTGEFLRVPIKDTSDIEWVYETMQKYNDILPENITSSRNFRLFYLRSVIDRELADCDFCPNNSEVCQQAMKEIFEIYHSDERTYPSLRPPYGKFAKSDLFFSQAY